MPSINAGLENSRKTKGLFIANPGDNPPPESAQLEIRGEIGIYSFAERGMWDCC